MAAEAASPHCRAKAAPAQSPDRKKVEMLFAYLKRILRLSTGYAPRTLWRPR